MTALEQTIQEIAGHFEYSSEVDGLPYLKWKWPDSLDAYMEARKIYKAWIETLTGAYIDEYYPGMQHTQEVNEVGVVNIRGTLQYDLILEPLVSVIFASVQVYCQWLIDKLIQAVKEGNA